MTAVDVTIPLNPVRCATCIYWKRRVGGLGECFQSALRDRDPRFELDACEHHVRRALWGAIASADIGPEPLPGQLGRAPHHIAESGNMQSKWAPLAGVTVIGITGHARHGKDTLARELMLAWPGAERFAFSDGIAAMLRARGEMGAVRDPRKLQDVGYAVRGERPDAWHQVVYGAIADRQPSLAIITGIRFEDEAEIVWQMGGWMLRVTRRNADGSMFESPDRPSTHPVEQAIKLIAVDHEIIVGPGEMEVLALFAAGLVEGVKSSRFGPRM
jgi:hypothetical protein